MSVPARMARGAGGGEMSVVRSEGTYGTLPQQANLLLYQGDDFHLTLVVTDAADQPADLSDNTPMAHIRARPSDAVPMAIFDASVLSDASDTIALHLTHQQATALVPGSAVWDCQVTDAAGQVSTLCAGAVQIIAEVTR